MQTASDGDEAIALVDKEAFDLVILDVKMARVDGFQILKHVKVRYPNTRVVLKTSFPDLKVAVESKKPGAEDLLEKPYDPAAMLAAVARALGKSPAERPSDEAG